MTGKTFLKASFVTYILIMLAVVGAYKLSYINNSLFVSILAASVIMCCGFILGIITIRIGINKSHEIFIFSILGGMVVRLIGLTALVFICLKFLELNPNNFIFSILFFYVFFLLVEIFYLNFRKR
jgi:hypothetical protein